MVNAVTMPIREIAPMQQHNGKMHEASQLFSRKQFEGEGHAPSVIATGELRVNLDTKTLEANGQLVDLTSYEYQMLELLSLRKGTTLTKEMFLNHLYCGMDEPEIKIIDVFICKLRKKLQAATGGQHYIETVWGRGYVLRDPSDGQAAA